LQQHASFLSKPPTEAAAPVGPAKVSAKELNLKNNIAVDFSAATASRRRKPVYQRRHQEIPA
jgi:hypothetical protein